MNIAAGIGNMDWGAWAYALVYAFIGAGASSVNTALGAMVADPTSFNVQNPRKLLTLMAWSFILPGLVAFFAKLSQSPLPKVITVTTTETTSLQQHPTAIVKETVQTTEVVPKEVK